MLALSLAMETVTIAGRSASSRPSFAMELLQGQATYLESPQESQVVLNLDWWP